MNSLAQPPQLAYASLTQTRVSINAHAQQEGYAAAIRRTSRIGNRKDGDVEAVDLDCSRSHLPSMRTEPCHLISSSSWTGCFFKASVRRLKTGGGQVQVANGEHNHEPFTHKAAHSQGRYVEEPNRQSVLSLTRAGVKPSHIIALLRQNSDVTVTARDIYNLRDSVRNRMLDGRSPFIALVNSLPPSSYFTQVGAHQSLTHLLIISPSAKEIRSKYSAGSVWLIDATYKTNRYGVPLLHIVGVSATSCKFTFAYCFMRNENVVNYLWASRHLREVFQNYHIQAELTFVTDRDLALMNRLVAATTIVDYVSKLASVHVAFPVVSIRYFNYTWLVYKEKFVSVFLWNKCHYGHVTTSRVEVLMPLSKDGYLCQPVRW